MATFRLLKELCSGGSGCAEEGLGGSVILAGKRQRALLDPSWGPQGWLISG